VTTPTLSARALNRAALDRQMLLERSPLPLTAVVEHMGGIQMQYAPAGYIGLWSRMRHFTRPMLTSALEDRLVVQGTMLRATIHTVSAADYWATMAGIGRVNREWYARVQARALSGVDMETVAAAVREELADGPLRRTELEARLAARGIPARAAGWAGLWVELVRVPPSGTWDRRRADLYGLADAWIPRVDVTEDAGIEHLVRRYLGAFGPAPVRAIGAWMGLRVGQIRHVVDGMGLRRLTDAGGTALVDLPDATLPDPGIPAPVRFLGVWDALLLVHARRTEVLPEASRPRVFSTKTPHSFNTFLVDGQVAGTWRHEPGGVSLDPFRPLTRGERAAVDDEAHQLEELFR
jgi:hypothetical protein